MEQCRKCKRSGDLRGPGTHENDLVELSVLRLSEDDPDRAGMLNSIGWNGLDSNFGHSLADGIKRYGHLTEKQWDAAHNLIRKYAHTQLGIEWPVPKPDWFDAYAPTPAGGKSGTIEVGETTARIKIGRTPQFNAILMDIKSFPTRKYLKDTQEWAVPVEVSTVPRIEQLAQVWGFELRDPDGWLRKTMERSSATLTASSALDAELEVDGELKGLLPFQRAGVRYILDNGAPGTILADEMGLGKTVQSLAAAEVGGWLPVLVVCPAVVKFNWLIEARRWLPHRSVTAMNGGEPIEVNVQGEAQEIETNDPRADITVITYDGLHKWVDELTTEHGKVDRPRRWGTLIIDEAHYIKTKTARRTKNVQAVAELADHVVLLTGTPLPNRPRELVELLRATERLDVFGGEWPFLNRYCFDPEKSGQWGRSYDGGRPELMPELNQRLRAGGAYCRREKKDVYQELPPKRRTIVPMVMEDREGYAEIEADLRKWFEEQAQMDAEFNKRVAEIKADHIAGGGTEAEAEDLAERMRKDYVTRREYRARGAEALVKIEATKQAAVRRKLGSVIEWLTEFLDTGKKIVVYAHHREVVEKLSSTFGCDTITGSDSSADRQKAVERFQDDPEVHMIVCNLQAGGVGITLTAASDVAFIELPWRPGDIDQAEDRIWGRINDLHGANSWFLLASQTVEEKIAKLIDQKRAVVEGATIGKVVTQEGLMQGLKKALMGEDTEAGVEDEREAQDRYDQEGEWK